METKTLRRNSLSLNSKPVIANHEIPLEKQPTLSKSKTFLSLSTHNKENAIYPRRNSRNLGDSRIISRKPSIGKEVISLAEKWLENCNEQTSRRRSISRKDWENGGSDAPSRDVKVYIPLEKTYRAELRQITARIGLPLSENDSSKAAKDYVAQNPNEAERIITQEKQTIQSLSLSSNASEFSRLLTTQNGQRRNPSLKPIPSNDSRNETATRQYSRAIITAKNGNKTDNLSSTIASSTNSKAQANHRQRENVIKRSDPVRKTLTSKFEISNNNNLQSTGIRVGNNEVVTSRRQSIQSLASWKRTPIATNTVPSAILEDPLKLICRENHNGAPLTRRNSHVSTFATGNNLDFLTNQKAQTQKSGLTRRSSVQYMGMPGYDVRYHMNHERPWINEQDSISGFGDPDDEILIQEFPSQETMDQSVKKCFEWLKKCPSPSSLRQNNTAKNLTEQT